MGYWEISWDAGYVSTESSNSVPTPGRVVEFVRGLQNTGRRVLRIKAPDGRTWAATQISALLPQLENQIERHPPPNLGQAHGAWT
jgi:hypothetical protein